MTTYEPGQTAVATVRGVPNVRVMRYTGVSGDWFSESAIGGAWTHLDSEVADVRPLVALDLTTWLPEYVARIPAWLRDVAGDAPSESLVRAIADQIEAQTKPPRIPEPGPWGVVRDAKGWEWVHTNYPVAGRAWTVSQGFNKRWDEIEDPVLIREGVES